MRILRARSNEVVIGLDSGIQATYTCVAGEPVRRSVWVRYTNGAEQNVPRETARSAKRKAIDEMRRLRNLPPLS